jgi:mitogen-activated protein kinase 1/3
MPSFAYPFTSDHHQLSIILDILGTPSLDDFYAITSQRSREYLRALPFRKKKPFGQLFPEANPKVRKCNGADPS